MPYRLFETRMTIGKHKFRGNKVQAELHNPFGMSTVIRTPGEPIRVVRDGEFDIEMRPDFDGNYSILTCDGGVPMFKFPTPKQVTISYHDYSFIYRGIAFRFEVRLKELEVVN